MEQHPTQPPPAPHARTPTDRAHWTVAKQRVFLTALLETGCVTAAARAAGMSRFSAHRLRRRLAGTPFDRSWDGALKLHTLRLANPFGPDPAQPPPAPHPASPRTPR